MLEFFFQITSHLSLLGNYIVVVNGEVLLDEVIPFFINSTYLKPASLKGSIFRKLLHLNLFL